MEDSQILNAIQIARRNWNDWRDVFEHGAPIRTNPLLAEASRFKSFLRGYSVVRTIRSGTHDDFLIELRERLPDALRDDSGCALDDLEVHLRVRFGTHEPRRRITSALSKVAAFLIPERFVAWDSYAKRGVNIVRGRTPSFQFSTYADYLAEFDSVWNGETGQQIRDNVTTNAAAHAVETEPRFVRRVLDVCLMKCGGRTTWGPEP